jgi:lipoprotein NlpD
MEEGTSHGRRCGRLLPLLLALLFPVVVLQLAGCGGTPAKSPSHKRDSRGDAKFSASATWYRVKKGDTLYAVSWRAGVDYKTLARWNGLKHPYTIYPGQLLRLKPPGRVAKSTPKRTTSRKRSGGTPPARGSGKPGTPASAASRTTATKRQPARSGSLHWQWPVKGRVVARFSHKDPDRDGIKIAGSRGQKIMAAEAGTVVYTGSGLIGYGQLIIVKHNNEFLSAYGLNSRLHVKEGQRVKKGQHISDMGIDSAGRPMLHFEIRRYGKPVDPMAYLPRG